MGKIGTAVNKFQKYRWFRILFANIYPLLKKLGIISVLQQINRGSFSDPYNHLRPDQNPVLRTYDMENFDEADAFVKYTISPEKIVNAGRKYNFGIVHDSVSDLNYLDQACSILGLDVTLFDIKDPGLYRNIKQSGCDGIFILPSFSTVLTRTVFHEVAHILSSETDLKIYPSLRELDIYESKRTLAAFLDINEIPHPQTSVFYNYAKASEYLETCSYPVVFKTHTGASASGVEILWNRKQALRMARQLFFKYYLRKLEGEKRSKEWGYMLVQEYIADVSEFRIIKIGDSWFGYQKWKDDDQLFLSGSGKCKMITPDEDLLNFCSDMAEKFRFSTMCFDIFVDKNGVKMVNELQTWFGSYDPSEMYVDNIPGRYRRLNGKWIFEPGFYNVYGSNLLRLADFISILQKEKAGKAPVLR